MADPSTIPRGDLDRMVVRDRTFRRIGTTVLIVFLAGAMLNLYGVQSRSVEAESGGYRLSVLYPSRARPGLAAPWELTVERAGGFTQPVEVAVIQSYMDLWDENGLDPQPSSATTMGDWLVWRFDPPIGEKLVVSFDARIEPSRQSGREGRAAVLEAGSPVVQVSFDTKVMP